ncbi:MAG: phosphoglycolate phosphatase [Caulobacterales bacterium]
MPSRPLQNWTIAWDLDGTLVDSAPDLVRVLNMVLAEEGLPAAPYDDARNFVGHGARALIERAFSHFGYPTLTDELATELTNRFLRYYADNIAQETKCFPGIVAALDALSGHGAKHAICTNKRTALSIQLLEALILTDRFSAIIGADSASRRKPDAAHLIETIAAAKGDLSKTIMVGDSRTDSGAARAAGAPFVLVSYGYAGEPLEAISHDALAHSADEIAAACLKLAAAH